MVTKLGLEADAPAAPGGVADRAAATVDWPAVREAYEAGGLTLADICRQHGVPQRNVYHRIEKEGWVRRAKRRLVDRSAIIKRMFGLLDRHIVLLEQNMKDTGEKEVAVLGKLASTLEKLIEIDNAQAKAPKPGQSKEIRDIRDRLAERIEQLKRE